MLARRGTVFSSRLTQWQAEQPHCNVKSNKHRLTRVVYLYRIGQTQPPTIATLQKAPLMRAISSVLLSALCLLLLAGVVRAEKGSQLNPVLAKPGKIVLEERFDGQELAKGWATNKGTWQVKSGTVVGQEKKEDMHAAVLTLQKPFQNTMMRFSFKRDGAQGFNLSFNHPKGHLFRIIINDASLAINKDKDAKDANSKAVTLGKADGKFPPGQWITLQVEVVGDKVVVQSDNGVKVEGSNPALAVEKTGYRFVTRGESLLLDDLTIWQVD